MTTAAYPNVQDANFSVDRALPNGAATVHSTALDLGAISAAGAFLADAEILVEAPALVVGDLGNGDTMKYHLECDSDAAFGSPRTFASDIITQTGAGGAGAAADTARLRLPSNCERYVRLGITNSGAGDASDKEATISLRF
jgi:hypothetical protein